VPAWASQVEAAKSNLLVAHQGLYSLPPRVQQSQQGIFSLRHDQPRALTPASRTGFEATDPNLEKKTSERPKARLESHAGLTHYQCDILSFHIAWRETKCRQVDGLTPSLLGSTGEPQLVSASALMLPIYIKSVFSKRDRLNMQWKKVRVWVVREARPERQQQGFLVLE
jgi:hypothetical protein